MEASLSSNASFSWRSIIWAREQIKDGFMWCIGNGEKVRILSDKWIPELHPRHVYPMLTSNSGGIDAETKVAWLIDKANREWKEDCLELFTTEDAGAIRRIPLGELTMEDFISWPYNPNGKYSVKSGYHFITQKRLDLESAPSTSCSTELNQKFWKRLWALNIPPKVRMFNWRLCLNTLPCYENLRKKRINVENWCQLCNAADGSLIHLFINCQVAMQVWALSYLGKKIKPYEVTDLRNLFEFVLRYCEMEVAEKFCIILWILWKNQNQTIFDGEKSDPMSLLLRELNCWESYKCMNMKGIQEKRSRDPMKWKPPPVDKFKVNVDAACDGKGNNGLGMIVRDYQGNFIFAKTKFVPHIHDVQALEALAIKMACCWCKDKNIASYIIESDAQTLVQMIQTGDYSRNPSATLVKEALGYIQKDEHNFEWIPRSANEAAHVLAMRAKTQNGQIEWHDSPPEFLKQIILDEKRHVSP